MLIIGVLTAKQPSDRRKVCIDTWFGALSKFKNIYPVWLIGNGQTTSLDYENHILSLPCKDGYDNLIWKTHLFCKWVMGKTDYVFKCDDDTFIVIDRFLAFKKTLCQRDYVGCDPVNAQPKYASGGAGYFLSRKAIRTVASMDILDIAKSIKAPLCAEDIIVGSHLNNNHIKVSQDIRFKQWNLRGQVPDVNNDIITGHCIRPDQMISLHKKLNSGYI